MKALLMKDYYMSMQECRRFALVSLIFIPIGILTNQVFWLLWPSYMVGLMPYVLMSYEEQCAWPLYAETMPYGRAMIVKEKYLFMLINAVACTVVMTMICAIVSAVGYLDAGIGEIIVIGLWGCTLPGCIMMPIVFKLGVAKAKLAYSVTVGCLAAITGIMAGSDGAIQSFLPGDAMMLPVTLLVAAGLFWGSCQLSIRFYMKKEL